MTRTCKKGAKRLAPSYCCDLLRSNDPLASGGRARSERRL